MRGFVCRELHSSDCTSLLDRVVTRRVKTIFSLPRSICTVDSLCWSFSFFRFQELVKTRMQVSGNGIMATVTDTAGKEGIAAFWKGLTFAYGRELSYTSVKLGAYAPVRDAMGAGGDAPFYIKFVAGAITGGVGSLIGNPFDVMKTLAQTNKEKAAPLMTLVSDMHKSQGIAGFYRGVEANVLRACVLNATKVSTGASTRSDTIPTSNESSWSKTHQFDESVVCYC
jgi:hypothetical protein